MQEHIIQSLHHSIEVRMQAGEILAPAIEQTSQLMVNALLNDKKIVVAGNGNNSALGQIFVASLLNRLEQERPGLPAMSISADGTALTAISNDWGYTDVFAKQIRALGQPGDVFLMVSTSGTASNLVQALAAAHDRNMPVVALTGKDGGDIATLLDINDIELRAPTNANTHIQETHLFCLLSICELIDRQLFGG